MAIWHEAQQVGRETTARLLSRFRDESIRRLRKSMGLQGEPPPPDFDPETAYMPVDGMARQIHGDLPAMLIGGLASLLLQMNHPAAMAGVAQFSMYRQDPLGRLYQTAQFLGTTTFGSERDALAVIDTVRFVHEGVQGTTHLGERYWANDPRTLLWVHCAETAMFLRAAELYGPRTLSRDDADRYVYEMARVARDLGCAEPPTSRDELFLMLEEFRDELDLSPAGLEARNFVLRGVFTKPVEVAAYATLSAAAVNLLPSWARGLLQIPRIPLVESVLVRPAALALATSMRLAIPGVPTSPESAHRP